jgi:sugar lactone lactonase YvrE
MVSDTQTEGRAYQISIEHHVHHELQVKNAANWSFYALQTEEERGESGLALPVEVASSHDITFVNFHSYRVIASFQPCASAVKVSGSRNIRFLNFHCDSNSKAAFDSGVTGEKPDFDIRKHEFAWLDISGRAAGSKTTAPASVLAHGAKVQKLVGGFFNISGGAAGPHGDFYFVDAHPQRIYRWDSAAKQLSTISDEHMDPVNLAADVSGNLMVVSYEDDTGVYALDGTGRVLPLRPQTITDWPGKRLFVPVSDWRFNRSSLEHPAAWYISPDGTTVLPVGEDFLDGATSWGVKSSPEVRTFGLGRAEPGKPFYVTSESELRTWAADVTPDGRLKNFHLFAEDGGEGVTSDSQGNVYIAAGQIDVYDPDGKSIGTIDVPERPLQLVFGGENDKTLFIPARTALYSVRIK